MKASKFTDAQKAFILKQGADGHPEKAGISGATYCNWKKIYGPPPRSASAFEVLNRVVCINLSGLFTELFLLLVLMGFARPRPS